jgi:hypothetical protein
MDRIHIRYSEEDWKDTHRCVQNVHTKTDLQMCSKCKYKDRSTDVYKIHTHRLIYRWIQNIHCVFVFHKLTCHLYLKNVTCTIKPKITFCLSHSYWISGHIEYCIKCTSLRNELILLDRWWNEMTKITNSNQSHKSCRKYKSENGRT